MARSAGQEPITIRRVRGDEWGALRDLRLSALGGAPDMFGTTLAQAQERTEEEWREAASRGEHTDRWVTFVADDGDRLVGMASGTTSDADVAELIQMWVGPDVRRRGVGTRLGRAIIAWAADRGASVLRLAVNESEPGAVALYRSLGFSDTGRREPDLFAGREALAMIMEAPLRAHARPEGDPG